jgi:hypothetical protein
LAIGSHCSYHLDYESYIPGIDFLLPDATAFAPKALLKAADQPDPLGLFDSYKLPPIPAGFAQIFVTLQWTYSPKLPTHPLSCLVPTRSFPSAGRFSRREQRN